MFYNISFKAENRVAFFNRIKNNDYDCVIMSYDQFGKIPHPSEMKQQEEYLAGKKVLVCEWKDKFGNDCTIYFQYNP
ncbi:MAG: hypothetical protein K2J12_10425 [Muribaculaceae bacterium]|nr:hypothetical protein [Muribaculaceae bacterium]